MKRIEKLPTPGRWRAIGLAIAWWCLSAGATANASPPLGTLFYTPAQRQEIERLRQAGPGAAESVSTSAAPTLAPSRVSGVVQRADGKGTIWINTQPISQETPGAPKIRGVDAMVHGKRLRVGESLDPVTGRRTADVPPGAVQKEAQP